MSDIRRLKIVTHYSKDDPQFTNDYYSVEVFVDGKLLESYSDHYHDYGQVRAEEFVAGYAAGSAGDCRVERVQVADADD